MKKIVFLLFFIYSLKSAEIIVKIYNIKNNKGNILIGIYNKAKNFPKIKKKLVGVKIKAKKGLLSYTFKNLQKKAIMQLDYFMIIL